MFVFNALCCASQNDHQRLSDPEKRLCVEEKDVIRCRRNDVVLFSSVESRSVETADTDSSRASK